MKYLLLLLLISCNPYVKPSPKYEPAPEEKMFKKGDCFVFIEARKEHWENQPEVIVKVLEVGIKYYLLHVVENPIRHSNITYPISFVDINSRISCPEE